MTRSLFSPAYARLRDLLVAARHSRDLTQIELSQLLGRPQSFVSKYERGERRLDLVEVVEITVVLGIDAGAIVTEVSMVLAAGSPGTDPALSSARRSGRRLPSGRRRQGGDANNKKLGRPVTK